MNRRGRKRTFIFRSIPIIIVVTLFHTKNFSCITWSIIIDTSPRNRVYPLEYSMWCLLFGNSKTTWLPCKKHDRDSHGNSMSFLLTTRLGGGLVQIHIKFHEYSMSFTQVLFVFHAQTSHGFWTSSIHGISMAFAKKMTRFRSDLAPFSTKLLSKRYDEIRDTCFTGYVYIIDTVCTHCRYCMYTL